MGPWTKRYTRALSEWACTRYPGKKWARIFYPISERGGGGVEHGAYVNWYFSLDNLIAASARLLQFMDRLELKKPDDAVRPIEAHF